MNIFILLDKTQLWNSNKPATSCVELKICFRMVIKTMYKDISTLIAFPHVVNELMTIFDFYV